MEINCVQVVSSNIPPCNGRRLHLRKQLGITEEEMHNSRQLRNH